MAFELYPAIDLRQGRVVRLQLGDPARETVFSDDPVAAAERWMAAGASWLHVVNLDGALNEAGEANWQALRSIMAIGLPIQFGGGLRNLTDIERALEAGAQRVIIGTVAIERPEIVAEAIDRYGPARILVSLDARDGRVSTHGWQRIASLTISQLARLIKQQGVTTVVYTDIGRDGMLTGANVEATAELAQTTGLNVIASGGVRDLTDIRRLVAVAEQGVSGAIIGRALYEGQIDLAAALRLVTTEE